MDDRRRVMTSRYVYEEVQRRQYGNAPDAGADEDEPGKFHGVLDSEELVTMRSRATAAIAPVWSARRRMNTDSTRTPQYGGRGAAAAG